MKQSTCLRVSNFKVPGLATPYTEIASVGRRHNGRHCKKVSINARGGTPTASPAMRGPAFRELGLQNDGPGALLVTQ